MKQRIKQRRRFALLVACAIVWSVLAASGTSLAVGTMVIQGYVRDSLGRALEGAEVRDNGGALDHTDASGHYRLEHMVPQTYMVTVSRSGLVPTARSVSPEVALQAVNFTATYTLNATLDPTILSMAPADVSINATTSAPSSGLCVNYVDIKSGGAVALRQGEASTEWVGAHHIASTAVDDIYPYRIEAKDCVSGTVVSAAKTGDIRLDRSVPQIVPISPVPGGNAFASSIRIAARVIDAGSNLDPRSVEIWLSDLTLGTPALWIPALYDGQVKAITSANMVPLVSGHEYRARLRIADQANESIRNVDFLAATITIPPTTVEVPAIDASAASGINCALGLCDWSFNYLVAEAAPYEVSISGSKHAGFGGLWQSFSLQSAEVTYSISGVEQRVSLASVVRDNADLRNRLIWQQIATIRPGGAQSIGIPGVKALIIDPIQVRLPDSALSVAIEMLPVSTDGCPNPDDPCTPTPPRLPTPPNPSPYAQTLCMEASGTKTCNPDPLVNHISNDEARWMADREGWAAKGVASEMASCDAACKLQVENSFANPAMVDSVINEVVLDPIGGVWLDAIGAVNARIPGVLPPLEPTYPSPWAGTHYVDSANGMAYPTGHPVTMLYDSFIGPMCEYAHSCNQELAQQAFATNSPEPVASSGGGGEGISAQSVGGGDDATQPQCSDSRATCQEACVSGDGKAKYESNACKQSIKLILGNYGGLTWQQDNRKQTFFTWVVHGRGMANLDLDSLGMGWARNPNDGEWKAATPYRGGQWRRAQTEPTWDANSNCVSKWTAETTWAYGTLASEKTPGVERDHYGRKIWQGNDAPGACSPAPSNTVVTKRRLVAGYLFMSLFEDTDHSTSATNTKSAQPAAGFVHRFKKWEWSLSFPCPYGAIITRSGKTVPFPCPTPTQKEKSWSLVIDPGRKYYW